VFFLAAFEQCFWELWITSGRLCWWPAHLL